MSRSRASDTELRALRARIDLWRANRRGRDMPGELWEAAASAARRLGVSAVATALGLGYAPLKARAGGGAPTAAAKRPAFIEVSGSQLLAPSAPAAVTIELTRGEARMKLTLPSSAGLDVAALVNAFARA